MDRPRRRIEPLLCCTAATVSLLAFIALDPFSMYDGFFFGALVEAYPFFLLTPLFALAGIYAGKHRVRFRLWATAVLVIFLLLPETWKFAGYWLTHLYPVYRQALKILF